MDEKTLHTLEYYKILDKLAGYCAFSASAEKAQLLRPCQNIDAARRRLAETSEAVRFLSTRPDMTIGGARDIREPVELAARGGVLEPQSLLDVKSTLIAARVLARSFERLEAQFPNLFVMAANLPDSLGLVDAITRAISDRGEIMDSASDRLRQIRHDLRIAHDRLLSRLQRIITDPKNTPLLQEAIITSRDGRYVIPLRAEFRGRIKSVVHDQSSSGATLFVEPLSMVEHNNEHRELQIAERNEERRILTELSHQVGAYRPQLLHMVDNLAELDLAFARSKYADELGASEPAMHAIPPKSSRAHPGSIIRLARARHPLLDQRTVVAIDFELDAQTFAVIVTGPNTGGKTVTLKTVGLLALMAQSGLHIPAAPGSEISFFPDIFADIGDEQSIEQSLSTFSGHITNIIHILENAGPQALVILDELGAGTDPQEGAALARAILSHLLEQRITTLVTTHHPELKMFAHSTPGAVNASVEFDLETLRPTYHMTIGLPGRSNALAIAQRLGMPEAIIATARAEISPADLRADDLLNEIHRQRDRARQSRSAADRDRAEAESMRQELRRRLDGIEEERRQVLLKARGDAEAQMLDLEDEVRQAKRFLERARQPIEALLPLSDRVEELRATIEKPVERQDSNVPGETQRPFRLGDKVRLRSLNTLGVIASLGVEEAEVQVGMLRIRARFADLAFPGETSSTLLSETKPRRKSKSEPPPVATGEAARSMSLSASPGMELDLRGQRADDALDAMERYLDAAYLAGMPFVRIIHGKGTGKLRLAVRETLSHHPHVKSFEQGGDKEGGEGVTVVKLHA